MIGEHDRVVLTDDITEQSLKAGDVGTVVHVYSQDEAFEVEFVALDGETVAVVTVKAPQVRPVGKGEIASARPLAGDQPAAVLQMNPRLGPVVFHEGPCAPLDEDAWPEEQR